jgi:hypothetical protein
MAKTLAGTKDRRGKNIDEDKTSESKKSQPEILLNVKNADDKTSKGKNVDGGGGGGRLNGKNANEDKKRRLPSIYIIGETRNFLD